MTGEGLVERWSDGEMVWWLERGWWRDGLVTGEGLVERWSGDWRGLWSSRVVRGQTGFRRKEVRVPALAEMASRGRGRAWEGREGWGWGRGQGP